LLQSCHVAGVVGLYITGLTWFAHKEAGTSPRRELCLAAAVIAAAIALAVFLPTHRWSREAIDRLNEQGEYVNFEPDGLPLESFEVRLYPYFLLLFAFHIAVPIGLAIRDPSPQRVQFAVKCCILGLIGLDAVMAFCVVGWPGLLILLLLAPALVLGKWAYST
jgi:4-hydroxybenzoate polyprenyltransferase